MHSRMRARVSEFQKVLNRAKAEAATGERKTVRYASAVFFMVGLVSDESWGCFFSGRTMVNR